MNPSTKTRMVAHHRARPTASLQTGRAKNEWSVITFSDIAAWQTKHNLGISALCRVIGISNATFYSWKKGSFAPATHTQRKILNIIHQDTPVDPGRNSARNRPATLDKDDVERRYLEAKQAVSSDVEDTTNPSSTTIEVATSVEIAAITATAQIVCARLQRGPINDNKLAQLVGDIQQALLGDF